MKLIGKLALNLARFIFLTILFFALFAFSGSLVAAYLPQTPAEPGPFDQVTGLLIVSAACTLVIILMIESSRWYGWKLAAAMSLSYYGAVTFVTQLEAWYFLYGKTISAELMPRLFLQGLPVAFIFIPLAVSASFLFGAISVTFLKSLALERVRTQQNAPEVTQPANEYMVHEVSWRGGM